MLAFLIQYPEIVGLLGTVIALAMSIATHSACNDF